MSIHVCITTCFEVCKGLAGQQVQYHIPVQEMVV